jgi:hypothetical protein
MHKKILQKFLKKKEKNCNGKFVAFCSRFFEAKLKRFQLLFKLVKILPNIISTGFSSIIIIIWAFVI